MLLLFGKGFLRRIKNHGAIFDKKWLKVNDDVNMV